MDYLHTLDPRAVDALIAEHNPVPDDTEVE